MRRFLRALLAWQSWATLIAGVLTALLVVTVLGAFDRATDEVAARKAEQRAAAVERADLQDRIRGLEDLARTNAENIGVLVGQVTALQVQVEQMCRGRAGCTPVVTRAQVQQAGPTTTTTTVPRPSPPAPSPGPEPGRTVVPSTTSTTSTTQPPPSCTTLPIAGRCL